MIRARVLCELRASDGLLRRELTMRTGFRPVQIDHALAALCLDGAARGVYDVVSGRTRYLATSIG